MRDECRWDAGQLLSFTNYDASLGENYISLGGYGWYGFNQRELGEDAMALLPWFPDLSRSCLRFMSRTQYASGDMPQSHGFSHEMTRRPAPDMVDSSDTEIWFLLGCGELGLLHADALDEPIPYRDGEDAPLWDHCRRAFRWVRDGIGRGRHGLVKSHHGDWNDYLFPMGRDGEGESMMNTGMAARACELLADLARQRGDDGFAAELETERDLLRDAAGQSFTSTHFVRGYTDAGRPVGGAQTGRVFINAQSWPALGGCGTAEQRRTALETALRECATPRGLCLVSRPFPSPPPGDVSSLPIPAGEGEICVRGPSVFLGYWNRVADTAHTFRSNWHHTGDIGRFDADGYLWYVKRKPEKELIKPGGENVYPAEVEGVIMEHPDIAEVSVIGVPDRQWGEAVLAVCVTQPGKTIGEKDLIDYVASRIARYKKPHSVVFVDALPKTGKGGIDRDQVKNEHGGKY